VFKGVEYIWCGMCACADVRVRASSGPRLQSCVIVGAVQCVLGRCGVATVSIIDKIIGLFCRIASLL